MLKLENVNASYKDAQILKEINLLVNEGEVVAVVGNNGAGKSTLLKTISGIVRTESGGITYNGIRITNLPPSRIARLGIAHVPEGRRIFPGLSVLENLEIGTSPWRRHSGERYALELERVFGLFPELSRKINALGWSLSGGQQQMLAIARGLMARPKLLMLDEPSLGLAPILVGNLFDTIRRINALGTDVLIVEQNAYMALTIASRGYVMETGKMVMEDSAANLLEDPLVREAYLGKRMINPPDAVPMD